MVVPPMIVIDKNYQISFREYGDGTCYTIHTHVYPWTEALRVYMVHRASIKGRFRTIR